MSSNDWMNNPALKDIDKSKLEMFMALAYQSSGKSPKELLPFLLATASRTKSQGKGFAPEEVDLIIEVMKQGKPKEEVQNIEKLRNMMKMMR